MRITVNVPDALGRQVKEAATGEKVSVSRLTTMALVFYLERMKKERLGGEVLGMVGAGVVVAEDVLTELERGRGGDDRS